jgi:hypothetical protein
LKKHHNKLHFEYEHEKEIKWTGPSGVTIIGQVDIYNKSSKTVIELKTTSAKDLPIVAHLRQIKTYQALLDSPLGILIYIRLGEKYDKCFVEYYSTWAYDGEKEAILDRLDKDASELHKGFLSGDPSKVSHIANDPNYHNRFGWMCNRCPFREPCEELRAKEAVETCYSCASTMYRVQQQNVRLLCPPQWQCLSMVVEST